MEVVRVARAQDCRDSCLIAIMPGPGAGQKLPLKKGIALTRTQQLSARMTLEKSRESGSCQDGQQGRASGASAAEANRDGRARG